MNIEVLGTLASILVLVSFMMKSEKMIRSVNIIGAIIFVMIYGAYGVTFNAADFVYQQF